jgi:hypothetical protein
MLNQILLILTIAKNGLTPNKKYSLDFFYAERHTNHSRIMIETNMISLNTHISFNRYGCRGWNSGYLTSDVKMFQTVFLFLSFLKKQNGQSFLQNFTIMRFPV